MPDFQAVSRATHASLRWRRYSSYAFAAGDAIAPLVAQELPRAAVALPIAFIASEERFLPVAVQGLAPGRNLFVAPDGRWLGGYVPAVYRGYPFALADTADGQQVLCFDAESGLLSDTKGEPFFDAEGAPAPPVREVIEFLSQVHANREATTQLCAVLQRHGLIQPWPARIQTESGEQAIEGLHRIDEAALNALSSEAFDELRHAGGLPLIYSQLLSMQHMPILGRLAQAHAMVAKPAAGGELDLEFLKQDGTIRFGNLDPS